MATILIADDDQAIRDALRYLLEDEGYMVYEAATTQATLDHQHGAIERLIVLLDLYMPQDTLGLMRTIAADPLLARCHVNRLFTATHRLPAVFGCDPIFTPFDLDELLAQVRRAQVQLVRKSRTHLIAKVS